MHLGNRPTGGAEALAEALVRRIPGTRGADRPGLVRPVELEDAGSGALFEGPRPLGGDGLAAGEDAPQGERSAPVEAARLQHQRERGRDCGEHRHPVSLEGVERSRGVEAGGSTTVGTPSSVGVTCAVHRPKPKGAGTALRITSSSASAPTSTANR